MFSINIVFVKRPFVENGGGQASNLFPQQRSFDETQSHFGLFCHSTFSRFELKLWRQPKWRREAKNEMTLAIEIALSSETVRSDLYAALTTTSVTRLGDLLDFGQVVKAFGNN